MTDPFPADEPLAAAPEFYIEPKDRSTASEHTRQAETVKRLRSLGLKVTAIPNARGWGMKAWNVAKAEGAEWGASDLVICAPGGRVAFVEFKNGAAMPEQHQTDWLNSRHRMGFPVAVCRTAVGAIAWLREVGFVAGVRDAA